MVPVVDGFLKQTVRDVVANPFSAPGPVSASILTAIRALAPAFEQFRQQFQDYRSAGRPFRVAEFVDEDDIHTVLPVIVSPDLTNVDDSEKEIVDILSNSGIKSDLVDWDAAQKVFVDRMSEFLQAQTSTQRGAGQQSGAGGKASPPTIVNCNKPGFTVLYCKGFYISTSTAFGISTPASNRISSGRYSFGIVDPAKGQIFENVLWTCPTTVRLNLP